MNSLLAAVTRRDASGGPGSVAELVEQLRGLLAEKVSPRKAEHISASFEFRSNVTFQVPLAESHDAETIVPAHPGGDATRDISAIDAFLNQPQDDPVLQTSVTKHLITTIGDVDSSTWIVRSISRAAHGWCFTYICGDSCQAWARQAAKNPAKLIIGAWSSKDGEDPVNMARPAFDCRGSVEIVFNKSIKAVQVKYAHSPFHKTVAQLMELLAPPPSPVQPLAPSSSKELKTPKHPKEPKTPVSVRKKRRTEDGHEDGGDGTGLTDTFGAVPRGELQDPVIRPSQENGPLQSGASGGLADQAEAEAESIATTTVHSLPKLPPGEADRRRELATNLLNEANIDPSTLSVEQFDIFANQSPALQQESLAMLVKYGAERLRIVHPARESSSTPTPSPPPPGNTAAGMPPQHSTLNSGAPSAAESPKPRRGGACQACRERRTKCDKETPSCLKCRSSGRVCIYPPKKGRARQKKGDKESLPEDQAAAEGHPVPLIDALEDEPEELPSLGFYNDSPVIATHTSIAAQPPEVISIATLHPPEGHEASSELPFPTMGVTQHAEFNHPQNEKPTEYLYPPPDQKSTHQATSSAHLQNEWAGSASQQDIVTSPGKATMPATSQGHSPVDAWPVYNSQQHAPGGTRPTHSVVEAHVSRGSSTTQNKPYQGSASASSKMTRMKSGPVYPPQTRSPVPQVTTTTSNNSTVNYSSYSQPQQSAVTEGSSDDRIAYEPYAYRATSNSTNSGHYGHTYEEVDKAPTTLSNSASQTVASSYGANHRQSATQWGTISSPTSRARDTWAHTSTATSQANKPPHQHQKLPNALPNMRQQAQQSHVRESSNSYGQTRQQPAYQSQQQQAGHSTHAHVPRPSPSNSQPQNWYGFGGNNVISSGYGARTGSAATGFADTGSHAAGSSYNQQQHAYEAGDSDHALYILRNA
ncbi:hypothetical protein GQ53DRAFT_842751 [Thozetella sp. PMI_491]|nr:hypothetical protein GQ53DRAFT_842751 [Thozetella sp. PMI_491]